jgi:hypothetical protein
MTLGKRQEIPTPIREDNKVLENKGRAWKGEGARKGLAEEKVPKGMCVS